MRKPLWAVQLTFLGEVEIDGERANGGSTVRYVRAEDASAARRAALAEAKEQLGDELLWSVEEIERARRRKRPVFHLFDEDATIRPAALAELAEDLAGADLWLRLGPNFLEVVAEGPEGYDVAIQHEEMAYRVRAAEWHGHFEDAAQAVACFNWLLTPFYRVATEGREERLAAAWIERYEDDGWTPFHPVLFRNPTDPTEWMGGGWERTYRQQNAQSLPLPYADLFPRATLDERSFPEGTLLGTRRATYDWSMVVAEDWLNDDYSYDPGDSGPPPGLE